MNDVYFKASLQNTLNPEVGTFDNVNNKEGTFTLEDGEYYLTNNTSNSYRVYYPTKDIYSVGFTIEFDINYNSNSGFKWLLLFNGDDSTYWHGFSLNSSILRYVGNGLPDHDLITSTNTWLHVKCIFDYYFNQNAVHIYIDNVEVNNFIISNNYGIKYIDILGNSSGYVADAKIKNIIIYNSSKKHYLDTIGLTSLWSKIKSLFATKTELGSKANDSEVVHKSGNETIAGTKTFSSNIVGNLTGNADTATKATQDSDGNQINTTYSKNGHTHDDRYYTETEVNNLLNGKANDAEVVHKSGNETVNGTKTFTNIMFLKSSTFERGNLPSTNVDEDREFELLDKNNKRIFSIFNYYFTNGNGKSVMYAYNPNTTNHDLIGVSFDFDNINSQKSFVPNVNDVYNLGTSSLKWKTINGINPGALSLPSNNSIDILSTLQSGGYTAPGNGYVRVIKDVKTECASTLGIRNETTGIEDRRIAERIFLIMVMVPVKTGEKVIISDDWSSIGGANITYSAFFYPCSGNV